MGWYLFSRIFGGMFKTYKFTQKLEPLLNNLPSFILSFKLLVCLQSAKIHAAVIIHYFI